MQSYLGLRGPKLSHAALALVVAPAFLCYGYNQAVTGGLLTLESFVETFPEMDTINTEGAQRTYNANIQGTVVALYLVGGIFGSLSCIQLGDMLGRRWVIFLASGISMVGAILMATSFQLAQFIVARLILGFGTGGYVATVPVWHAELSRPTKRGADVVTAGFFIGLGIALSLWIDFGLYFVHGSSISWRLPLAVQVCLSLLVMSCIFFLPESPRWLMKKGRYEEARSILAALEDVANDCPNIDNDLTRIQSSLDICCSASFMDIFKSNNQRISHRTLLAVLGQTFQQMCGINAITFYATTIFEQYLGLDATTSRILAAGMASTQPVGGVIAYFTIDRFGRRKLMLSAAVSMSILMAILAGTTSSTGNQPALIIAVIALFLFPFIFTVGFAGLTFLYATEVAPLQYRAAINALSTAAVWVFNFVLAQVTPVAFDRIHYQYYIVFACVNAAIVPVLYFLFPETGGLSLEDIDTIFSDSQSMLDPPKIARRWRKGTQLGQLVDEDANVAAVHIESAAEKTGLHAGVPLKN